MISDGRWNGMGGELTFKELITFCKVSLLAHTFGIGERKAHLPFSDQQKVGKSVKDHHPLVFRDDTGRMERTGGRLSSPLGNASPSENSV